MTYCVGITTSEGLVMASDSRSNAGYDQVNICRKMHTFITPGERVFVLLSSGSLSCSQSVVTLLRRDFDQGLGLASVGSMYDAARYALISIDSTMRSNVTVGPPIDLLIYSKDDLKVTRYRRFAAKDPDLLAVHAQWETALRKAVQELPPVRFGEPGEVP